MKQDVDRRIRTHMTASIGASMPPFPEICAIVMSTAEAAEIAGEYPASDEQPATSTPPFADQHVDAQGGDDAELSKVDAPIEVVAEKVACPSEPKHLKKSKTHYSLPTVWVVHSGCHHGDKQLVEELGFEVQEIGTWHDYGQVRMQERQLRKLKQQTPDLLIIWISIKLHENAQPRRSLKRNVERCMCAGA